MNKSKLLIAVIVAVVVALVVGVALEWRKSDSQARALWQQAVRPGALSQSHAFLSNECVACHTPVKGVEPALCISCHADNTALLQRQPTAFHANVQVCGGCHVEHEGTLRMPTTMDHSLLAEVGHALLGTPGAAAQLKSAETEAATRLTEQTLRREQQEARPQAPYAGAEMSIAREPPVEHPRLGADESMLNCAGCHSTKDRHQSFFGADCVQCHSTKQWTIARFVHPSARSTECAQCHKPPPSHNMMHFSMMSAPIAGQPKAKVNQCFLCHQTTSWNDIRGVGMVKHH